MAAPGASETVVVVTGGDAAEWHPVPDLAPGTRVIAADSGVDLAHAAGLTVHLAVGDFDSVSPEGLARATAEGAVVERHRRDKDATDLELALDAALALGPRRVHVVGGHGGRLDHLLANAMLLAAPAYAEVEMTAQIGPARVAVIRGLTRLLGGVGDVVSLLAVHGPATGVTTTGLLFPLVDEVLEPGSTRGISNELTAIEATVSVAGGVVVAIQPGQRGELQREGPA